MLKWCYFRAFCHSGPYTFYFLCLISVLTHFVFFASYRSSHILFSLPDIGPYTFCFLCLISVLTHFVFFVSCRSLHILFSLPHIGPYTFCFLCLISVLKHFVFFASYRSLHILFSLPQIGPEGLFQDRLTPQFSQFKHLNIILKFSHLKPIFSMVNCRHCSSTNEGN